MVDAAPSADTRCMDTAQTTPDLAAAVAAAREAEAVYHAAIAERDDAIRRAAAADPRHSRRRLATLTGLSFQRVSQVLRNNNQ